MRIAIWHNLPSGGGKRALYDHVRGLKARGHTVEAWCPPTADPQYLPLSELITEHIVPLDRPRLYRDPLRQVLNPYRQIVAELAAMDDHCRRCAAAINLGGFDLLLSHPCQRFRLTAIGRMVAAPAVMYLQEPYRWLYEALPALPWAALPEPPGWWRQPRLLRQRLRDSLYVRALRIQAREEVESARAYDRILVNSLFSRESVLRAYGLEAQVCYLGVDLGLFNDQGRPREDFVVSIGALTREKKAHAVIQALGLLPEPRPRLVWIANVASPTYQQEVLQLAAELGVEVDLRLRIPDAEVVETLNRARLLAYAPHLEPLGLAPLEANACGAPVVAAAEGGVRETVLDGVSGLLVTPTVAALSAGIQRLRSDPAYAAELGRRGRERVLAMWTNEHAIDRLETHLLQVLEGHGATPASRETC
jgi:glycosyltransferase involved in cell wall biosynthesis